MAEHKCPYGPGYQNVLKPCGDGWLCDLCREDRADARNRELIEAVRSMRDADAQIGRLMKRIGELETAERGHFEAFQHLLSRLEAKEKSDE